MHKKRKIIAIAIGAIIILAIPAYFIFAAIASEPIIPRSQAMILRASDFPNGTASQYSLSAGYSLGAANKEHLVSIFSIENETMSISVSSWLYVFNTSADAFTYYHSQTRALSPYSNFSGVSNWTKISSYPASNCSLIFHEFPDAYYRYQAHAWLSENDTAVWMHFEFYFRNHGEFNISPIQEIVKMQADKIF